MVETPLLLRQLVAVIAPPLALLGTAGLQLLVDVVQRGLMGRHLRLEELRRTMTESQEEEMQ